MSRKYGTPDGGRYTRPRRGFRTKSHYSERLHKRGQNSRSVKMLSLQELIALQGPKPVRAVEREVVDIALPPTRRSNRPNLRRSGGRHKVEEKG